MAEFKKGDKVRWNAPGGVAHGTVEKEQTTRTHIKGHTAAATKEEPQFIVRSDKGGKAAHKPQALTKE